MQLASLTKLLQYLVVSDCILKEKPSDIQYEIPISIQCKCGNIFTISPKQISRYRSKKIILNCGCIQKKWTNVAIDSVIKTRNIIRKTNCNVKGLQPSISKITWECKTCLNQWNSCVDSVINKQSGCPHCSGNVPYNVDSLNLKLKSVKREDLIAIKLYDGTSNKHRTADFSCFKCKTSWNANIHNVIKFRYGCPNCNNNIGIRTIVDGVTFHSKLEYYFWSTYHKQDKKHTIIHQQKYLPNRRLTCDFYFPTLRLWVEVTGGVLLKRQQYSNTLEEKRNIIIKKQEKFVTLQNVMDINNFIRSL